MNNEWEREQRTSGWIHIDITLTRINMKRIFFVLAARSSIRSLTNRIDEIVLSAVLDRLHHLHLLWEFRIARKLPLNLNCTRPQCTHTKHRWVIFCCGFWMVCCQRFSPFSHCARNRMRRNCAHISLIIICSWHETLAKLNEIFLELANKTVYLYIRVFIKNRTPDVLFHFSRDIYVIVCVCGSGMFIVDDSRHNNIRLLFEFELNGSIFRAKWLMRRRWLNAIRLIRRKKNIYFVFRWRKYRSMIRCVGVCVSWASVS